MKKRINILALIGLLGFTACEQSEDLSLKSIEGTYVGSLTSKSATGAIIGSSSATADISKADEGLIQVHCFGAGVDTTFMLNYFGDNDSVKVCLTGTDFQNTYGHTMGLGHMGGGMMGDIQKGQTEWQHHMANEHMAVDKHSGGFDMMNNSFGYTFNRYNGSSHTIMNFEGIKK